MRAHENDCTNAGTHMLPATQFCCEHTRCSSRTIHARSRRAVMDRHVQVITHAHQAVAAAIVADRPYLIAMLLKCVHALARGAVPHFDLFIARTAQDGPDEHAAYAADAQNTHPDANCLLSGLKASESTQDEWPVRQATILPCCTSKSKMRASSDPVRSRDESGENARARTGLEWPLDAQREMTLRTCDGHATHQRGDAAACRSPRQRGRLLRPCRRQRGTAHRRSVSMRMNKAASASAQTDSHKRRS
jgi:hypothetical protein